MIARTPGAAWAVVWVALGPSFVRTPHKFLSIISRNHPTNFAKVSAKLFRVTAFDHRYESEKFLEIQYKGDAQETLTQHNAAWVTTPCIYTQGGDAHLLQLSVILSVPECPRKTIMVRGALTAERQGQQRMG